MPLLTDKSPSSVLCSPRIFRLADHLSPLTTFWDFSTYILGNPITVDGLILIYFIRWTDRKPVYQWYCPVLRDALLSILADSLDSLASGGLPIYWFSRQVILLYFFGEGIFGHLNISDGGHSTVLRGNWICIPPQTVWYLQYLHILSTALCNLSDKYVQMHRPCLISRTLKRCHGSKDPR